MKWINYTKYTGDDLGISAEDLLQALSDFLLESGFRYPVHGRSASGISTTLEDLKKAIQQALEQGSFR